MMTAPKPPLKPMGTPVHSNVRQITNAIIRRAMKEHSSDIHIIPLAEHSTIRFRIDGDLSEPIRIPISLHEQVISFFRNLAEQMYSPMSDLELEQSPRRFEVRVGALAYEMEMEERPSSHGEYIILHVCKNKVPRQHTSTAQLYLSGLHKRNTAQVTSILNKKRGVILLSGPFGSGKTTTMYSFLHYIHSQGKKAISFEKDIEMKVPHVTQLLIPSDNTAFMATEIFNQVERHQPDVIMLDLIGDQATAAAAFALSARGYLVISSIRAVDTASVLSKLKAFDISCETIGQELKLGITQRLMHRLCPECHEIRAANTDTLVRFDLPSDTASFNAKGCRDCMGTGFSGRIPVHETCIITEELGALLRSAVSDYDFRQIVVNAGMLTLFEDALIKALEGLIPLEEVLRTLPKPTLEHTVGARLHSMMLLPDNKNLLVSTGDAEAMINQDKPETTNTTPSAASPTPKVEIEANSIEEAIRTPTVKSTDTLTLTEDDLPKPEMAKVIHNVAKPQVTHFTARDEAISNKGNQADSLLKTLSAKSSLTDTMVFPNGINLEAKKEPAVPAPRFQAPKPASAASMPKTTVSRVKETIPGQINANKTDKMKLGNPLAKQPVAQPSRQAKTATAQQPMATTQPSAASTSAAARAAAQKSNHDLLTSQFSKPSPTQTEPSTDAEQDAAAIQNKTMRFQAATTPPAPSAANVLQETLRFQHDNFSAETATPTEFSAPQQQAPQQQQPNPHTATTGFYAQHQQTPQQPFQPQAPQHQGNTGFDQNQSFYGQPAAQQPNSPFQANPAAANFAAQTPQANNNFQQSQSMPPFQPQTPSFEQQTQAFQQPVNPQAAAQSNYFQFEAAPKPQQPSNQQASEPKVRKKLLLVEDGHTIRDYISFILRSGGYDVVDVETAEEALSILFHERPDALISDHILPGMNGTSLIATVRSHPRLCDIPTMLLTSETKMEVEALRTGADSYLEKPVDPDLLLARLGSLLAAYDRMASH